MLAPHRVSVLYESAEAICSVYCTGAVGDLHDTLRVGKPSLRRTGLLLQIHRRTMPHKTRAGETMRVQYGAFWRIDSGEIHTSPAATD